MSPIFYLCAVFPPCGTKGGTTQGLDKSVPGVPLLNFHFAIMEEKNVANLKSRLHYAEKIGIAALFLRQVHRLHESVTKTDLELFENAFQTGRFPVSPENTFETGLSENESITING